MKRVAIDRLTRVEGHGKVTILLDDRDRVVQARLHIVEFRGFEMFVRGRPMREMPALVQRLCGICPVSHHLCAAKATDRIVGAGRLTPTAEKMRRLMHYGQIYQSHALHFFHLSSPDLLFGFDAPVGKRNVAALAATYPELARQAILMRKFGQEVIRATGGKRIHPQSAIPGGVNCNLTEADRDQLRRDVDQQLEWAQSALRIARAYTLDHWAQLSHFAFFESNHLALTRADGAMDLYDGNLNAVDAHGTPILQNVDAHTYADVIAEEVRDWSYLKFPFIKALGSGKGWYRVGPLARMNVVRFIDTPLAEAARQEFRKLGDGQPINASMAYHWARMIEVLHAGEKIKELLFDADLQGTDLVVSGQRRSEGIGVIEAPRGTLFHHYRVDDDDLITMVNLIVSTTNNNEAMNLAVAEVAREHLSGVQITEGLLNHIEVAVRAYDPCLSCGTHALGQMDLEVTLLGPDGHVLDQKAR
jgi:NAD-reducing hydrogenase large subunit